MPSCCLEGLLLEEEAKNQIFNQILVVTKALIVSPFPPSLKSSSVTLPLEAAQEFLLRREPHVGCESAASSLGHLYAVKKTRVSISCNSVWVGSSSWTVPRAWKA